MFPRRILIAGLVALVILGLVVSGNAAQQREAWTQGFLVGRLSAGSSGSGSAAPLPPEVYPGLAGGYGAYGYGGYGAGPHFGGFGFLLLIGLGLLFFMFAGRFLRHNAWRHHGGWGPYGGGPSQGDPAKSEAEQGEKPWGAHGPWWGGPGGGGPGWGAPWHGGPGWGAPTQERPAQDPEQPPAGAPEQVGWNPDKQPGPIGRRWYA
jgi:hypothetical protein